MYAVLVVTPPPPLQREVTFQKGGRNDARVRYNDLNTGIGFLTAFACLCFPMIFSKELSDPIACVIECKRTRQSLYMGI